MKTYAIIALMGIATAAHALMIDDFSTGNVNDAISSGSNITHTAAAVPGGFRTILHAIEANPLNLSHSTVVINGIFASDNKTQVDSITNVGYGFDGAGNLSTELNLDLSSLSSFKFSVLSNDLAATLRVRVWNGASVFTSTAHAITPNMVLTNQEVNIDFSEFVGANFADIDAIAFDLDSTASGDTVIDSFEAVPEPASMIALGLGVAALISRKRKA